MNETISKIHLEILDQNRQGFLKKIIPVASEFILGGGTALALQIRHRQSFDFDFFNPHPIQKNLLEKIARALNVSVSPLIDTADELTLKISDDIKTTFLFYPFKKAFEQIQTFDNLKLFPILTIAAQKAYTIGRRGVYRDYFDIFTLLNQKHLTLEAIMTEAARIYGDIFNEKLFLSQLVYFDDLTEQEITPLDPQDKIHDAMAVRSALEQSVQDYLAKRI